MKFSLITMGADAALGAVCGALYGISFGGFGPLVHGEIWRIFSIAGTCALAGLALGALGSALQRVFDRRAATVSKAPGRNEESQDALEVCTRPSPSLSERRAPAGIQTPTSTAG